MRFHLYLEENESKEDINELSITAALLKFLKEQNEFNSTNCYEKPIFIEDIVNILAVIVESNKRYYQRIEEVQNAKHD